MGQKIYISGQITGLSRQEYSDMFGRAEAFLMNEGWEAINPLKVLACEDEVCTPQRHTRPDGSYIHSWQCYMRYDIKAMMDCDSIAMLPNWKVSEGASVELEIAETVGMTTYYFNPDMTRIY